jgi:hypothetical protein
MSDIDPLIRRELNWMALGVLENRDISELVFARVRRRRIKRAIIAASVAFALIVISAVTYAIVNNSSKNSNLAASVNSGAVGSKDSNALEPSSITGLISDYPLTWEQSVGDLGAISKAAGIGDTLGGLTAQGLKISWQRCSSGQCPITWVLALKNNTEDLVSISPALALFADHSPLVSYARPTTVTPGSTALLVYSFPELKSGMSVAQDSTWQWNWYLTVPK